MTKRELISKLNKIKKEQKKLEREKLDIEEKIESLKMKVKPKRIKVFKHKKGEEGSLLDYKEMIITGEEIGTIGDNHEFRITKFNDGTFGFFINTNTQGNFVLKKVEVDKLKKFIGGKTQVETSSQSFNKGLEENQK